MSNFYSSPIKLKGHVWKTTEHYFQAQKFVGTKWESEVRKTKSAWDAAQMGRRRDLPLRRDWESVKDDVMREAVLAKFTQHPDLRAKLLATGSEQLVEHTFKDTYWADGGNGSGKNMLGRILMEVREQFLSNCC
jgi:ribA/ribD-fused uncharacterized protein